jgi:hypothetical protein
MQANTNALIFAINQGGSGPGGGGIDAACCSAIVNAVAGIEATMIRVLLFLPQLIPSGGTPIDLVPIVTELTCLCDSLNIIAGAPQMDLSPIASALAAINSTLATPAPFNDSQLKRIADDADTDDPGDDAFIDYLVEQGGLDAGVAAAIKGKQ